MTRRNLAIVVPDDDDDDDPIGDANAARWNAAEEAGEQVSEALVDLDRESAAFLRLPYPSLDAVVGGIAPGDIWFVAAFSGRGKTTLLTSVVDEYVAAGRTVYFMGLESRPNEIRTHLACRELTRRWHETEGREGTRVDGGDVLSGAAQDRNDWGTVRRQLVESVSRQSDKPLRERLIVDGARFVTEAALVASCKRASYLGTSLMVIDHIDHIGGESGGAASFEESVRACNAALYAAQQYGMRMLVATQLNNQGVRADPLAGFRAPQPHHVYLGPQKRMIATGMLGLYRPLRQGLTADEMKAAREDRVEYSSLLEPNTMGVVVMKHRKQGRNEGKRISLGVEHGRVFEIQERDRYATSYQSTGPRP
jgi:hypothetical protein